MLFTFLTETFSGTVNTMTEEGRLEWVPVGELKSRPMAEGDRCFLQDILATNELITGKFCYTADDRLLFWQRNRRKKAVPGADVPRSAPFGV
jgi:8-oxo-dGTP diphosphatase